MNFHGGLDFLIALKWKDSVGFQGCHGILARARERGLRTKKPRSSRPGIFLTVFTMQEMVVVLGEQAETRDRVGGG